MTQQLPTNGYGLLGFVLLLILPSLLAGGTTLLVGRRTQKKVGKVQTTINRVDGQVTNGHGAEGSPNLRDDIDDVKTMLADHGRDIRGIRQDIGDLRGELRDERSDRIRGDQERAVEHQAERLEDRGRDRRPGT